MLRESLNAAPKPEAKKRRPLVMALLAGACVMALGLIGMQTTQRAPIADEAMHAHLTSLMDHHTFVKNQNDLIGDLIEEGMKNKEEAQENLIAIATAVTFAATKGPMIASVASTLKNVIWGETVARKTVDPAKIDASFDNSKVFAAEIKSRFPESYNIVHQLRSDLKEHHFDLSALIQEVSLLADSTSNDADKTIKKLNLRKKFIGDGKYVDHPEKDVKIWQYAVKRQVLALEDSIEKCDAIIVKLNKLQKDCSKTQDDLEKELDKIKNNLESSIKMQRVKMADLEQKLKATGCVNNSQELIRAIFTLGIGCLFDNNTQIQLQNAKAALKEEETILNAILKRMGYFDGLVGTAKELTSQASGLLESTKQFRSVMRDTRDELVNDYTDGEIVENMGDVDFANDFAESLYRTLDDLKKECARVSADCIARKRAMDRALVGLHDPAEEEEVVELAAKDDALFETYDEIAQACIGYWEQVGKTVDEIQNGWFKDSISEAIAAGEIKNILLMNERNGYAAAKNKAFEVLDAARDIHLAVESAQHRVNTNIGKIDRYVTKRPMWQYQHKYATKLTQSCMYDKDQFAERLDILGKEYAQYPQTMARMSESAIKKMDAGIKRTGHQCEQLSHPIPKPEFEVVEEDEEADVKTHVVKTVTKTVVDKVVPGKVKEFFGLDEEQKAELEKWAQQEKQRKVSLKMCQASFHHQQEELHKIQAVYKKQRESFKAPPKITFPEGLTEKIAAFDVASKAAVADAPEMTEGELKHVQDALRQNLAHAAQSTKNAEERGVTCNDLKKSLIAI